MESRSHSEEETEESWSHGAAGLYACRTIHRNVQQKLRIK